MEKKIVYVFKGVVFNSSNQILIDNRKEESLEVVNGLWELPGGKMEFGETPEETVKREIYEETGYSVDVITIIPYTDVGILKYKDFMQHTVVFSYLCILNNDEHQNTKDKKINEYRWINYDEIHNYNFLSGAKEAINKAMEIRYHK